MLAVPHAVYADAIAETDNSFFNRHQNDFLPLGRSFISDGEDGSVPVKDSPGSAKEIHQIENGNIVYVQYSCLFNGDYWGFTFASNGWIRLDQMLVLYDSISFVEEHANEFYSYEGTYDTIENAGGAILWSWPGSGVQLWTKEEIYDWSIMNSYTWSDPEGREWVFMSGYQGYTDSWICLSDPMNGNIPAFNPAPPPSVWVPETEHVDIGQSEKKAVLPIVILVAAVVIVTIVLIRTIWKKGRDKRECRH